MTTTSTRPNILFLLSDEHGFRYLSLLDREEGGEPVHTPALDALARRGTFFENAYCQMPLCTPSRICMLTGRDQEKCGAWSNGAILPPGIPTIPSHLAEQAGYETCAVGKMHLGGSRQFAGFKRRLYGDFAIVHAGHQSDPIQEYNDTPLDSMTRRIKLAGLTTIPEAYLQEQIVAREAIAFLREHRHCGRSGRESEKPWMLMASFSRPHFPWTAPRRHFDRYWPEGVTPPRVPRPAPDTGVPEHPFILGHRRRFRTDHLTEEDVMRARAAYMACVDFLDEMLGDFLATLERDGFLENTIIVYTTDHGEMAGEHGMFYKNTWHEGAAHVPFIIQTPEQRRGNLPPSRLRTPVSLGDLFPTLCGLLRIDPPVGLDGVDLSGAIRSAVTEIERKPILCQSVQAWRMVRRDNYKYIAFRDGPEVLVDVVAGPDERQNLAGDPAHASVLEELRAVCLDGFDFQEVSRRAEAERKALQQQFPMRIKGQTPNQIILPDGRLVEGDAVLYLPHVLAERASEAFDDWPG